MSKDRVEKQQRRIKRKEKQQKRQKEKQQKQQKQQKTNRQPTLPNSQPPTTGFNLRSFSQVSAIPQVARPVPSVPAAGGFNRSAWGVSNAQSNP